MKKEVLIVLAALTVGATGVGTVLANQASDVSVASVAVDGTDLANPESKMGFDIVPETEFDGEGVFFKGLLRNNWVLALRTEGGFISIPREDVLSMTPEMQESLGIELNRTEEGLEITTPGRDSLIESLVIFNP